MKHRIFIQSASLLCLLLLVSIVAYGQGTLADYERANGLRDRFQGRAIDLPGRATWIEKTSRFWYRKSVRDGNEFVLVDAATLSKRPAFDHRRLADSLSSASGEKFTALNLPFSAIIFVDDEQAIEFEVSDTKWKCSLSDYRCRKLGPTERRVRPIRPLTGVSLPEPQEPIASPDGKWEALVKNYNVFVRLRDKKDDDVPLSFDGSEGNYYTPSSIKWSPDSRKLAAYRVRPGYHRKIQYVESSPADQLQPKYSTIEYAKPGDALDVEQPVLFHVESKQQLLNVNLLMDTL